MAEPVWTPLSGHSQRAVHLTAAVAEPRSGAASFLCDKDMGTKQHEYRRSCQSAIDGASVHPREAVKEALRYNAAAVILVHFVARHKMRLMCP